MICFFVVVNLEIADLLRELKGIEAKWRQFGSCLGIDWNQLDIISEKKTDFDCLNDVLDRWFNDNPTLDVLYQALVDIDHGRLANEIKEFVKGK